MSQYKRKGNKTRKIDLNKIKMKKFNQNPVSKKNILKNKKKMIKKRRINNK